MSYLEQIELVSSPVFHKRLQVALWIKAAAILDAQNSTDPQKNFAKSILKGEATLETYRRLAVKCIVDGLDMSATDEQVQTVVDAAAASLAT